jgi:hypothetical protein
MTKKEYLKHKDVIEWWSKNDEFSWHKDTEGVWRTLVNPSWNVHYDYVINDGYLEFRKALVNNETVEVSVLGITNWVTYNKTKCQILTLSITTESNLNLKRIITLN